MDNEQYSTLSSAVSGNIKKYRKLSGMTQEELATAIGTTKSSISKYELGHRFPDADVIEALANAFGISPPFLLADEETAVHALMKLEQIDKYTWGKEAGPEVYRKIEENYQRHHSAQTRANKAMEQMTEEGCGKVADYAEDILPRYRREDTPDTITPGGEAGGEEQQAGGESQ